MTKKDFEQLKSMYRHMRDTGMYWGRKDYWHKRIARIDAWLEEGNIEFTKK